jgi:hypothetical protein
VAAKYASQLGRPEDASATIERTLALAQGLVAELMDDEAQPFEPGALRRAAAAAPMAVAGEGREA